MNTAAISHANPGKPHELWIGTSWKMNKTLAQAQIFVEGLRAAEVEARAGAETGTDSRTGADPRIQRFVIPPFTTVREVRVGLPESVLVGAQNMHWADAGAWTGEISPTMLVDCSLDMVELGHSERRTHFGETDDTVGRKVAAAVRHGLIPLICIGENLSERDTGQTDAVLARQVQGALQYLTSEPRAVPVLFAYEPVWAIGEGGTPASCEYADERHRLIKSVAGDSLGAEPACLYGGSVNVHNCTELVSRAHIDGLFIGRSAWQVEGYLDILKRCASTLPC